MNYITFSDGCFTVCKNGSVTDSECKMITHYKNADAELRRSHEWKSGTEPVFAESYMIHRSEVAYDPRVNGIASVDGDHFYYSIELEKGGGFIRKANPIHRMRRLFLLLMTLFLSIFTQMEAVSRVL